MDVLARMSRWIIWCLFHDAIYFLRTQCNGPKVIIMSNQLCFPLAWHQTSMFMWIFHPSETLQTLFCQVKLIYCFMCMYASQRTIPSMSMRQSSSHSSPGGVSCFACNFLRFRGQKPWLPWTLPCDPCGLTLRWGFYHTKSKAAHRLSSLSLVVSTHVSVWKILSVKATASCHCCLHCSHLFLQGWNMVFLMLFFPVISYSWGDWITTEIFLGFDVLTT